MADGQENPTQDRTDGPDQRTEAPREPGTPSAASDSGGRRPSERGVDLTHETVEYPDRLDRCTVYPPETSGIARMERWLTVDRRVVVDLRTER